MTAVSRYVKITAKAGQEDALTRGVLGIADSLRDVAGCELFVINRSIAEPDVLWISEQWASQDQFDAALEGPGMRQRIAEMMAMVREDGLERIDLQPLGGIGCPEETTGFTVVELDEVEDMAVRFGHSATGEARFARGDLGATDTGLSLQRLRPGARQSFGHLHRRDEELYVILSGTGRIAVDEEVRDVKPRDAIRVAPGSARAFEAGPEGLEFLAMGTHHAGDAQMLPDFWPA